MTDNKREKMLEKVRALLAKAASTSFPEEADTARNMADRLMTQYAIESWEAETNEEPGAKMPVVRYMDFEWWSTNPFKDQLWRMFAEVGKHCRCIVVSNKLRVSSRYEMPVVGLPSDLDWFDMLFTNLMIAMIDQVDPRARPELSVDENMARMREAGMPWADALNRLALAGIVPSIAEEEWELEPYSLDVGRRQKPVSSNRSRPSGNGKQKLYFSKKVYERTITSYRQWCARTGHEQSKVSQVTFRRNFANGFAAEVNERLYRMRRSTETAYDNSHKAGSMALAVRDIVKIVQEAVYLAFEDLRPHPSGCDCESCHYCYDYNCKRRNCVERRSAKPVRTRGRATKAERVDYAAMDAGRAAGRQVNLSNSPSERIGGQKGLN